MRWKMIMIALLLVFAAFSVMTATAETGSTTLTVGPNQDYTTIQAAVDAASAGDSIHVMSGNYKENVVVTKSLSLIGEDEHTTFINGSTSDGNVIEIKADGCQVSGFTICWSAEGEFTLPGWEVIEHWRYVGMLVYGEDCVVQNCTFSFNEDNALMLLEADGTLVSDCFFTNNFGNEGTIAVQKCSDVIIERCIVEDPERQGFTLRDSTKNIIRNCEIEHGWAGINLHNSHQNQVISCESYGGSVGLKLTSDSSHNIIVNSSFCDNYEGVLLYGVHNNTIFNCSIGCNDEDGILIHNSQDNEFYLNDIYGNGNNGITADYASRHTIQGNRIFGNFNVGTDFTGSVDPDWSSGSNRIYHNNYMENFKGQAFDDDLNNDYDDGSLGNHWGTWTTPDQDSDGIVDVHYPVLGTNGARDNYPSVEEIDLYGLGIKWPVVDNGVNIVPDTPEPNSSDPGNGTGQNNGTADNSTEPDDDEPDDNDDWRPGIRIHLATMTYEEGKDQSVSADVTNVLGNLTYEWYIEGIGLVATGRDAQLDLPAGVYNLTLIVTNDEGDVYQSSVPLKVKGSDANDHGQPLPMWVFIVLIGIVVVSIVLLMFIVFRRRKREEVTVVSAYDPVKFETAQRAPQNKQLGFEPSISIPEPNKTHLLTEDRTQSTDDIAIQTMVSQRTTGKRPSHFNLSTKDMHRRLERKYEQGEIDRELYLELKEEMRKATK